MDEDQAPTQDPIAPEEPGESENGERTVRDEGSLIATSPMDEDQAPTQDPIAPEEPGEGENGERTVRDEELPAAASLDEEQSCVEDPLVGSSQPSDNSNDDIQRVLHYKWTVESRKRMKEEGMYLHHSLKDPVLKRFAFYLQKDLNVNKYRQEVQNVSRFLHFMDPNKVTLDFVMQIEKSRSFFIKLRDLNLAHQTAFNYLKNLRRYLNFHMRATNLANEDPAMYSAVKHFKSVTKDLRVTLSKGISSEVVSKR
ncbi:uncharacterized protein [Dendrobates tinctorius]|uniref:uncharacterized protein n=1 Tax=Dendrobates tinctorius TaxID=92724 RepID=UPI003CC96B8D